MMKNKKKLIFVIFGIIVVAGMAVYMLFLRPEPPIVYAYYSTGEAIVTNVKDTNRLFKTSVVLVLNSDDDKLNEDLVNRNAVIRDALIFILREMSEDEILQVGSKDEIRQAMITSLNTRLAIDNVVGILFNDYVMQ
jgi:flagellar FliL protein